MRTAPADNFSWPALLFLFFLFVSLGARRRHSTERKKRAKKERDCKKDTQKTSDKAGAFFFFSAMTRARKSSRADKAVGLHERPQRCHCRTVVCRVAQCGRRDGSRPA